MADILDLSNARLAIGLATADNSEDADLQALYIPAVTPIVEDLAGPVMAQGGRVRTADGGSTTVLLPSAIVSIESLLEDGVALVQGVGFVVNKATGIVYRGSSSSCGQTFHPGVANVVVTYTAGAFAAPANVPGNIMLCARIVLEHLWQNDKGGYRPEFGAPDNDVVTTPSGFAVPRRAVEALGTAAWSMPGFA
jgi:hypothetical protein